MARVKKVFCLWVMLGLTLAIPERPVTGSDAFVQQMRPLIATHCLQCHSTEAKEGGLDLERFGDLQQIRADIEVWETALGMIERNEMPPPGQKQLGASERSELLNWLRELLDQEAIRRSGDPGPALVRRLNNAEYDNAIRDLTGVELKPARQFPSDGAAGEGFLNATDALAISADQLSKYLDAAKAVAKHAVLLPDGWRFSPSPFRAEWSTQVLDQIRALYEKYTNEFGQIPYQQYLQVTIDHRDAFQSDEATIIAVAQREKLSPKYLKMLWRALRDDQPSLFLNDIRTQWNACHSAEDVAGLADAIAEQQALHWHKRDPIGRHALDDRYVEPGMFLANRRTHRLAMPPPAPDGTITFYLSARAFGASREKTHLLIRGARLEAENAPPLTLREVLQKSEKPTADDLLLDGTRFGAHPENKPLPENDFVMRSQETLPVRVTADLVAGRTLVLDVEVDPDSAADTWVYFETRLAPAAAAVKRGIAWTDVASAFERPFLTVQADDATQASVYQAANQFRQLFPARVCYPGVVVLDTVVTLERYHRGDAFLADLLLDDEERAWLDRWWEELHFISLDTLQVRASYNTLIQGEMKGYEEVTEKIHGRATATEAALIKSETPHLEALLAFAQRAYRRPLPLQEQQSLRSLYQQLRDAELPHDEALRSVLARVLISPHFLYRLEATKPGKEPTPLSDLEMATRLSFFLWASIPDEELLRVAEGGKLHDPLVLEAQVERMLQDARSRALAIEFGTQWLEVRNFGQFQGKSQELFPDFDAPLRRALDEESILMFQEFFRADLPLRSLLDADHTFVNDKLADFYQLPAVEGAHFRRVDAVKKVGRGGILGLASVLAKHSGAARTSPVLRGNWIAETLLGEKLPRPPDDVPELSESDSVEGLTIRQLVEKHAELPQCAICHQRIDPLGFALEEFDTIGRQRDQDIAGRPIDAEAQLQNGFRFAGMDGLKNYLLTERKDDFTKQFCRKLLGYALGRRILLSDRQLLQEMAAALDHHEGKVSAAILVIVRSKQFQFIRGSEQ